MPSLDPKLQVLFCLEQRAGEAGREGREIQALPWKLPGAEIHSPQQLCSSTAKPPLALALPCGT